MSTESPVTTTRKRRIERLVEKYGSEAEKQTFMGEPVSDLSREQLLAVLCDLSRRYTDMLNSSTKG